MSLKNKHLSIYQRKNTSYSWKTPAQEIETQIISPNPSRVIQDTGQWRRERSLRKSVRPVSCRPGALPCWWPPEEGQGWVHTLSRAQGAVPGAVGCGVLAPDGPAGPACRVEHPRPGPPGTEQPDLGAAYVRAGIC